MNGEGNANEGENERERCARTNEYCQERIGVHFNNDAKENDDNPEEHGHHIQKYKTGRISWPAAPFSVRWLSEVAWRPRWRGSIFERAID